MKKARLLAVCMAVSMILAGCGSADGSSGKAEDTVYKLGDTVSTDIVDFTLNDAYFCYYAGDKTGSNPLVSECAAALDEDSKGYKKYAASVGYVLVPVQYSVNNRNRNGVTIGQYGEWKLKFKVTYNEKEYDLVGYTEDGKGNEYNRGLDMSAGVVERFNTYGYIDEKAKHGEPIKRDTFTQSQGSEIYKTVGIAHVDPASLDDSFKITVNVINSEGEYEYFTYAVE